MFLVMGSLLSRRDGELGDNGSLILNLSNCTILKM